MKLNEYLKQEGVSITRFAERLGVTRNAVYNLLNNKRQPSLKLAVDIEKVTHGKVRPKDWIPEEAEETETK